jgi:tetratricopeptide (TPR) repeat protein
MSLLLDALKKAAEDKEKAKSGSSEKELSVEGGENAAPEVNEELLLPEDQGLSESDEAAVEENLDLELTQELDAIDLETDEDGAKPADDVKDTEVVNAVEEVANERIEEAVPEEVAIIPAPASEPRLPEYNHNDARKILDVNQKRYRNSQRMAYYGLYVFAALLFFAGSYLYYTAEILDNSDKPIFKSKYKAAVATKTEKEKNIERQVSIAKAKLSEMDSNVNKNSAAAVVVATKKPVATVKKQAKKIIITKQKKLDPISVLLQRAYKHYQAGEYQLADSLYLQILQRDKRLRDALLGRAAIAVVTQEFNTARVIYQQLLRYYPRDSIATAALLDLARQKLTTENESQLKSLLHNNPRAAHVYFSLGLLYAKQDRIKESQQAFFDAFSRDKKADYAYNLAVMLDKLGQPKAALSYYKQASNLSDHGASNFNEKLALERIIQLEAGDE